MSRKLFVFSIFLLLIVTVLCDEAEINATSTNSSKCIFFLRFYTYFLFKVFSMEGFNLDIQHILEIMVQRLNEFVQYLMNLLSLSQQANQM